MNEPSSLNGLRVVITRDIGGNSIFAVKLAESGAIPIPCPAIEIAFRNPPGFDDALREIDRFDWLVFTSANAVAALNTRLEALDLDPATVLKRSKIAVVGSTTRQALGSLGATADIVASPANARSLVATLVDEGIVGALVLFPASRIAGMDLARRLRAAGAGVVQFSVYDTVDPGRIDLPPAGEFDVVTFASPSAVRNIAGAAPPGWIASVPAICIGPTTAQAAREAGIRDVRIAPNASLDGLVAALLAFRSARGGKDQDHGGEQRISEVPAAETIARSARSGAGDSPPAR